MSKCCGETATKAEDGTEARQCLGTAAVLNSLATAWRILSFFPSDPVFSVDPAAIPQQTPQRLASDLPANPQRPPSDRPATA